MSIEFKKIDNLLKKKEGVPDKMGEEGIINAVYSGLDNEREFFAKQWYRVNTGKRILSSPESRESPCSPYWVKAKYYEYNAMHDVFPEVVVSMAGAFDPRITRRKNRTYHFSYEKGRPVTLTRIVKGNPVDVEKRDQVIDKAYDKMLAYHRDTKHGLQAQPNETRILFEIVGQADKEMQDLFGRELHASCIDSSLAPHYAIEMLLKQARKVNPQSPIVKFLEFGIIPIHPEFNFIPNDQTETAERPHGVFLELSLIDQERFITGVNSSLPADKAKSVINRVKRFAFYQSLDIAFDSLIVGGYMESHFFRERVSPEQIYKYGPEVQNALFNLFETVRKKFEKKPEQLNQALDIVVEHLRFILRDSNPYILPQAIRSFQREIKKW